MHDTKKKKKKVYFHGPFSIDYTMIVSELVCNVQFVYTWMHLIWVTHSKSVTILFFFNN